jgi:hypothetical protein
MEPLMEWDFSLAPRASRATWELLCSCPLSCCSPCSMVGVVAVAILEVEEGWSLDRETCRPALAMELRFDSGLVDCLRNATESCGLEMTVLEGPDRGLEIATGSLFDCIKAAMDNGW